MPWDSAADGYLGVRAKQNAETLSNISALSHLQGMQKAAVDAEAANAERMRQGAFRQDVAKLSELGQAPTHDQLRALMMKHGVVAPKDLLTNDLGMYNAEIKKQISAERLSGTMQLAVAKLQQSGVNMNSANAQKYLEAVYKHAKMKDELPASAHGMLIEPTPQMFNLGGAPSAGQPPVAPQETLPSGTLGQGVTRSGISPQDLEAMRVKFPADYAAIMGAQQTPEPTALNAMRGSPAPVPASPTANLNTLPSPQPVAAPAPAVPAPEMGANEDMRDVMARQARLAHPAAPAPSAPAAAPVPLSAMNGAPTAPAAPVMPTFTGSRREIDAAKNKWLAAQSKAGDVANSKAPESVIQAILDGRQAPPSGFAMRSPYWQDVIARVNEKDPNFDSTVYGARQAARKTFSSGPEAKNVTALNTVIGHLGTLDEAAQALHNKNLQLANSVINRIRTETGHSEVTNFETARIAVAEETMRVFRQVGASEKEAEAWKKTISSSASPEQLSQNISILGKLLDSRVNEIADQYERTVNQKGNPAHVSDKNRGVLDRLISGNRKNTNSADTSTASDAPPGVDPKVWAHMSPEGKKLWQTSP